MYKYFLFDLDGTLTDPGLGITNSVMYALKKFGIDETDRAKLYKFIGPPLKDSFRKYYGFDEKQCEDGVAYYREYFKDKGIFENKVYDGIVELLIQLKTAGKKIILATSKPEEFAIRILEHFELAKYFDFVAGASMDSSRINKADVISYALEKCKIEDLSRAVMIGDREHDVLGAKRIGLDSIGVLWGYGDLEELQHAGATYIIENVTHLLHYVTE